MGKKWKWFFDIVTREIEPVIAQHGFHPAPKPNHRAYLQGRVATALYESENQPQLHVQIQEIWIYKDGNRQGFYFWVTVEYPGGSLKAHLFPSVEPVSERDMYGQLGWVFDEPHEFNTVVHDIVQTLNLYFTRST
jgi:hypothetical protein